MTATDELRRLLDERGVKWDGEYYEGATFWNDETNLAVASEGRDGKLWVSQSLTPAQAIAATLGNDGVERSNDGVTERGTCHIVMIGRGWWECDACANGIDWDSCDPNDPPSCNFCPSCGAEVVDE